MPTLTETVSLNSCQVPVYINYVTILLVKYEVTCCLHTNTIVSICKFRIVSGETEPNMGLERNARNIHKEDTLTDFYTTICKTITLQDR